MNIIRRWKTIRILRRPTRASAEFWQRREIWTARFMQYRQALEIDPNSVEALANLANAFVSKGQLDEAITCYRSALQLDPNSAVLHFDLSVALTRQGNASEAEAERAEAQRLKGERTAGQ